MNRISSIDLNTIKEELKKNGFVQIEKWTYIEGKDEGYAILGMADGDFLEGAHSLEEAITYAKEINDRLENKYNRLSNIKEKEETINKEQLIEEIKSLIDQHKYDGGDPEDYLIDLAQDVAGYLEDKYGSDTEYSDFIDIVNKVIFKD